MVPQRYRLSHVERWFITVIMKTCPLVERGRGPVMSTDTRSNGSPTSMGCISVNFGGGPLWYREQGPHLRRKQRTSSVQPGQ